MKQWFSRYFARSSEGLIKHGTIMFVATSVANLSNYLFHVCMGRILGPSDYSIVTSLLALFMIISIPVTALQTVVAKYVSNFKAREQFAKISYLLFRSLKKFSSYSLIAVALFTALSGFIASFLNIPSAVPVVIQGTACLFIVTLPVMQGTLQGLQSFSYLGLGVAAGSLLRLIFAILLVYIGFGVNGAVAAQPIALTIAVLIAAYPLQFLYKLRFDDPDIKAGEIYKYFWPVLIALLCFTVLTNVDVVLVKHFFDPKQAGYYSAAAMFGKIVLFLPAAFAMVMFPKAAELDALDKDSIPLLQKSLLVVAVISFGVTVCFFLFPSLMVSLLFGSAYLPSAPLIGLFGLAMSMFALVNILIFYHLSVHNLSFVYPLALLTLFQVGLIWLFHDTLFHVVGIVAVNGFLLFLSSEYFLYAHRRQLRQG